MFRGFTAHGFIGAVAVCLVLACGVGAERLPVKLYTSADGLGSSFVNDLMTDSRGFLWLCTRDGLSRFDGTRFITYQIGEKDSPPGIETIYETRNGDYWIGTTGGLYRFRSRTVSPPATAANNTRAVLRAEWVSPERGVVLEDHQGQIWLGSTSLFRIIEENGKVTVRKEPLPLPEDRSRLTITDLREDADGSLWANSTVGLIRRLPNGRVVFYRDQIVTNQTSISMLLDQAGRIWLTRANSLDIFHPDTLASLANAGQLTVRELAATPSVAARLGQPLRLPATPGESLHFVPGDFLAKFPTRKLYQTRNGHVWLTTEKELLEFDGSIFHRYTTAQGLLPSMSRMSEDIAGNLWLAGQTGLIRLDHQSLRTYSEADGLNSASVQAITEAPDGTLYFANGDYFLSRFDGVKFVTERPGLEPDPLYLWTSRYAFIDRDSDGWILTRQKLYRFANSNFSRPVKTYSERDGLLTHEMFQIFQDRDGAIWVSQQTSERPEAGGLSRLPAGADRFYSFTAADGYPLGKAASSFAQGRDGAVWVGFYEEGLARYADGRFTVFNRADGVPKGLITDLLFDRNGRLWLASSGGGVSRIDDPQSSTPKFTTFTIDDGISSNNVRTLTEDKLGNIYLGTVRGVDRISADGQRIKHFSVNDGLAGDFVVDSHCDRNGDVWFATTSGLSRLVPLEEEPPNPPVVWLGGLRIAGVAQPISDLGQTTVEIADLNHTQNSLQVDFFSVDFRAGENLRYQYMFDGVDRDWSPATEQRTVNIANLRPGSYRFLVRAVNSNGAVSRQPAVITFRILSPIWLRWWFISLCGLALVLIVVVIYRYRVAHLRQVNSALQRANRAAENLRLAKEERLAELGRVRTRIATDLHDDIGASLTQIAILSDAAQQRSAAGNGAVYERLDKIYQVSNDLVVTMSDIVWAINPRKDHLPDLIQRARRFASDVLSAKDIDFEFQTPSYDEKMSLGANVRREVFLIFKESVNNIVKHSGASAVAISFTVAENTLRLRLSDDGVGFVVRPDGAGSGASQDTYRMGGNGLLNMRRRAADLGGRYSIESTPGEGTVVELTIPVRLEQDAPVEGG